MYKYIMLYIVIIRLCVSNDDNGVCIHEQFMSFVRFGKASSRYVK